MTGRRDGEPTRSASDQSGAAASAGSDGADEVEIVGVLTARTRLVGTAALVGLVAGVVGFIVSLLYFDSVRAASDLVFVLGSVAFGFGLLGWAGSMLVSNSVGAMQEHLGTAEGWTERGSRRAMARITGFGAGAMVGVVVATVAAGGV
ncbi:hypothetical protein ACFO0N_08665 [Halobium salinum]|uniref:Uncharacterized protein n=1 Tax=Halobium salinum TaxID=1364940 RepID=A0ABD5PBF1_9EURY|nr:hypothetical protein [Halobium salinum]